MGSNCTLVDTHAHLQSAEFERDCDIVVSRAISAGVVSIINVGFDLETSRKACSMAKSDGFFAAVGVHPHYAKNSARWMAEIEKLASEPGVVAIGETGLDYYRNLSMPSVQRECFVRCIELAKQKRLPLVIHDRDAHDDITSILRSHDAGSYGGVLHCFSGDWKMAKQCLDMGFYVSIAGPVTFRSAQKLQEVAIKVPLDRLLLETDCPYLAPEPYRGMRNEPGMVRLVAEKVASLRGTSVELVCQATTRNAGVLFGLDRGTALRAPNLQK